MTSDDDFLGKKIFFLYPQAVVQNRIMAELTQQEFEVYTVKEPSSLKRLLKKYPHSLVFGNIQEGMSETEWETWINSISNDPETKDVGIGVICTGEDEELKEKFLSHVGLKCGYTLIKSDLNITLKNLFEILKLAEAKGRRKFIRVTLNAEANAKVNFPVKGGYVNGTIKDISVAGFSCTFDEEIELVKNSLFHDIQVRLGPSILKTEVIVFGSRMDGNEKVYVVLFTQRVDPDARAKIRIFIQATLQSKLNAELKFRS
jgi:hypothetical protein